MYTGERKASSADFLLCKSGLFDEPFEAPENALIDENWLKDRPDTDDSGIPILYID